MTCVRSAMICSNSCVLRSRKKYVERHRRGTNLVLLEPDIARFFSSDNDVNQACAWC